MDLCKIPGVNEVTALGFISEIGVDMRKIKSGKHFTAWLNLMPNTKFSGGKIINTKMMKKMNTVGQYLKQAEYNPGMINDNQKKIKQLEKQLARLKEVA